MIDFALADFIAWTYEIIDIIFISKNIENLFRGFDKRRLLLERFKVWKVLVEEMRVVV